jgi:peroxiredoxin Q/BCP
MRKEVPMITTGDAAPDFTLIRDGGTEITLSAQWPLVLFFYPGDSTPTCTTEAQAFSAAVAAFHAKGVKVMGVSRDSLAKHDRFVAKSGLTVPLLVDEDGSVCNAYGVWAEKTTFGKTYMGIVRTTFLIGRDGRILHRWEVARVKGHVDEVLAAVEATA